MKKLLHIRKAVYKSEILVGLNNFYDLSRPYRRIWLSFIQEITGSVNMTWAKSIEPESFKRITNGSKVQVCSTYIIIYVNLGFNATEDLDIEVFYERRLWNAKTAQER